jgi:hypothetical protein
MNTHPQMRADTFHCSYAEPHWALQMHSGLLWVGLNDSSFVASSFSNCGFLMENRVPEATSIIATTLHRCQSAHRWLLLVKQVGVIIQY